MDRIREGDEAIEAVEGPVDPFPEAEEALVAERTKFVADLARIPPGTVLELELGDGLTQTGTKEDFGADGIGLVEGGRIRYADIVSYREILAAETKKLV